jgi:CubicO group peptidase (beta-lactamase class C family)
MADPLARFVTDRATELGLPGAAVAIFDGEDEILAFHGTTSVEDPRPLTDETLFHFGSITKTFTATAVMRLVADGKIDLGAPVKQYLPDFRLVDEEHAATLTITQLLNHTAGWSDYLPDGGDDSLERHVAGMANLPLETPPGTHAEYKNAGFAIVALILERLSGLSYDAAMQSMVFDPVGLGSARLMTRPLDGSVALGHNALPDGSLAVASHWEAERYADPSGGIVSTIGDQLRWARFHLGDGGDVLPHSLLRRMQQPTIDVHGSFFGDAIGISWFLRTVAGAETVGHGGSMRGQYSWLLMVPERRFAVVTIATAGPNGIPYNQQVVRWALERYLGLIERDPLPLPFDEARATEFVGVYHTDRGSAIVGVRNGALVLDYEVSAGALDVIGEAPEFPPSALRFVKGSEDRYLFTSGPFAGMRGVFTRNESGEVVSLDLAGRSYRRRTGA